MSGLPFRQHGGDPNVRDRSDGHPSLPPPPDPLTPLFRRTLIRVLSMQAFALLVLWFLQSRYHGQG